MSSDINKRPLGNPFSTDPNNKTYPLTKNKFYELKPYESDRKMVFVDGGNQKIFGTAEYSIQLNRVYFNIFNGKKRVFSKSDIPQRIDFLSLTLQKFNEKKEEVYYETAISPIKDKFEEYLPKEKDLSFKATEQEIMVGSKADIERVASMARRFTEWSISKYIIDSEMDTNDMIVRDGSLQTALENESKYTKAALNKSKEKGVIFAGLSKTSSLPSSTGLSLISSVQRFADECGIQFKTWCYGPLFRTYKESHKAVVMAIKLNKNADRIFRFEIYEEEKMENEELLSNEILKIVSSLIPNSNDIRFAGYPYGLYDADRWARVKNEEILAYETLLKSEISKNGAWSKIVPLLKSNDSHSRLDLLNHR